VEGVDTAGWVVVVATAAAAAGVGVADASEDDSAATCASLASGNVEHREVIRGVYVAHRQYNPCMHAPTNNWPLPHHSPCLIATSNSGATLVLVLLTRLPQKKQGPSPSRVQMMRPQAVQFCGHTRHFERGLLIDLDASTPHLP